jgi:hypothetical protein
MPPMLANGAKGAEVSELQRTLNARPPSALTPLIVDGIFGLKTQARVKEFQRRNGLQIDGIVGPATWGVLKAGDDGPDASLDEFRAICDHAVSLLRHDLKADSASALKGVNFFQHYRMRIEALAFPTAAAPVRGNALGIAAGLPVMAVGVAAGVAIALIVVAFILACMIVVASLQKPANPAEINTLTRKFEQKMQQIELELRTAPINIAIMLVLMKSAIERIIQERIDEFRRKMEKCKENNPLANTKKCMDLAAKVEAQMRHLIQQAQLTRFGTPESQRLILLGLARSFGFLVQAISDWANCVGCKLLQFL